MTIDRLLIIRGQLVKKLRHVDAALTALGSNPPPPCLIYYNPPVVNFTKPAPRIAKSFMPQSKRKTKLTRAE